MGRAPRTKETLLDFYERCWVNRHSRGFPRSQRTPGRWGVTLYIDLLGTVMKLGRVVSVSVHGEQTQSRLLEKTHQSNGNLRKNDSLLMPKSEFKLAPNSAQCGGGGVCVCVVNQA